MDCSHGNDWGDREWFREFFQKAQAARVPLSGAFELTRRCNLRCAHCYLGPQRAQQGQRSRELSTPQWLNIIDQITDAGCLDLLLTGGDPLLRPDFAEVYRRARLAGIDVTVFTNGTLLTDRALALFADLPPRLVEISVYGATAATYERVTGVPGSFAHCMAGIELLLGAGIRVGLKTVLLTLNYREVAAIESLAASRGLPFRFDAAITPQLDGGRAPVDLRVNVEDVVAVEMASPWLRKLAAHAYGSRDRATESEFIYQCGAGQASFHVDAFGNLTPCLMVQDVSRSLLGCTFAEAWQTLEAVRHRRAGPSYPCRSCELRQFCPHCPGLFQLENGCAETPSAYACALGRERLAWIRKRAAEEKA